MSMNQTTARWILVDKFCELTGYSKNAVLQKRKTGVWPDGTITLMRQGRIHVNVPRYEKWVETGQVRCRAA